MSTLELVYALLRVVIGLLFIGHGSQKLFGWFGGYGFTATTQMVDKMGFRPAPFWAAMNALGEFVGGILVALGFLTPIGAAVIIGVMVTAIMKVHWPKGIWVTNGGFEYNLVIIANMLFMGIFGSGLYSLDSA